MSQTELEKKLNEILERITSKPLPEDEGNDCTESLFESIKHINEYGQEFWYARELSKVLEYKDFRNFEYNHNKSNGSLQK